MTEERFFKVIAVLNEYRIVTSAKRGEVAIADKLEVVQTGPEIVDPDSHASLGHVYIVKAKLRVAQVEKQFSVAVTDEVDIETTPGLTPSGSGSFFPSWLAPQEVRVPRKLKIRPEDAIGYTPASATDPIVPGDLVRLLPPKL